jgi:hypothetical protein
VVAAAVLVAALTALAGAGVLVSSPPAGAASASPLDPSQPLVPRIKSISPDYVPDQGPIVIRGTVTNATDQTWTAINVHGFMGSTPMTTSAELSEAVDTPVNADVGPRITVTGTFDSIHALAPGQSKTFTVRLPRSTLPVSTPGVYWFGVHVLGDNGEGGTRVAVGRDRTFLPYVPENALPGGALEDTALVLPLRAGVIRGDDGAVLDPLTWRRSMQSGPLSSVVSTASAAGSHPLTWLADPAVIDVVRQLARGNPARTLTSPQKPGSGSPTPSPSDSPSSSGSSASSTAATAASASTAKVARQWLHEIRPLLGEGTAELLGLPYGDLAVETAVRNDRSLLGQAFRRTGRALRPWGLSLRPVASPPTGRTTGDTVAGLPRDVDTLLADSGVEHTDSVVNTLNGHRVLLTSTAAAEGGPGPAPAQSSLALRQRVLAESAIRALGDQQPLLVELPTDPHRPLGPGFFSGLDAPWMRLTSVTGATAVEPTPMSDTSLLAPSPDEPELGPRVYLNADDVMTYGSTLQSVLTGNHVLYRRLFEEVTGNASYAAAQTPFFALDRMHGTSQWVHGNLDQIDLAAPESVTLASNSGRFSALISNGLDVPVTVRVRSIADPGLTITGPDKVSLDPNGRTSVLLHASTDQRGVHNVRLILTTPAGRPLGSHDTFPMRAERVSRLIWVIIGAGIALLFAAIVVRLVRRILAARAARNAS